METKQEYQITDKMMEQINTYIAKYPDGRKRSAILSILHLVQDTFGWLSVEAMDQVAAILDIEPIKVYEVATFYTMFNLKPVGKYKLEFCLTSCCGLRGADDMYEYTLKKLGIQTGETTSDGLFTVAATECLGACGYAPMLRLDDKYIEHLTPESIDELIDSLRKASE
ncbi:MAG: NAD(P)H-dependent oxidoreductase subunit E [Chitinophagales bacterium]|nr:NAD(P)H-dependent oxidoreductase subunit E [Chitinophagales bacterium]